MLLAHPLPGGGWRAQRDGRGRLDGPLRGPGSEGSKGSDFCHPYRCVPPPEMTPPPSFRPQRSGVEKSHSEMWQSHGGRRSLDSAFQQSPKSLTPIPARSPARDDDVGGQHTVIPGSKLTRTMPRTTVISTAAERSGEISLRNVASPGWQEISRLCVSLEPKVIATHTDASPPQVGARFSGTISCFPLRGNAALAAKGCTRLRVEMKRKGCPDRQTAACLGGVVI